MPQIRLLDEQTIDKIAAGEVVERPSSVVKELVENAIDAGASAVTVEIKEGGLSLIRITDNGCGIEKDQIPIAFCRHSTSKLCRVEDLLTIGSLGFRGEALSSIASVAMVELITKTPDAMVGCRYLIEGGKEVSLEEIGAPTGTTFLVRDLFYNTPARKKFLKTAQTEAGYISDLMDHMALSHPEVSFKFIHNGQIRLHTSGNGKQKDIIYHIYGRDIAANLLEVNASFEGFSVHGYIGKPAVSRGNRNFESYFINGRYIKSKLIAKAIEDAYHGFMMQHKYPFTVLSIDMDGSLIDVNVHPNKMELRFSNGEDLYEKLVHLIQTTLRGKELIAEVSVKEEKKSALHPKYDKTDIPEPFEYHRLEKLREAVRKDSPYEPKYDRRGAEHTAADRRSAEHTAADHCSTEPAAADQRCLEPAAADQRCLEPAASDLRSTGYKPTDHRETISFGASDDTNPLVEESLKFSGKPVQTTIVDYTAEDLPLLSEEARPKHRIIGQLFETYWLVEYMDKFYMIDQHAAHEKVLFEQTMARYRSKDFYSQLISPPILLSLTMQEENRLKKHLADFEKLGFVIEPFGGKEYTVSAVPGNLYGLNGQALLLELIDGLGGLSEKDTPDMVIEKIASMSCKAAVKGNQKLSRAEIEHLIDDLLKLENPYFCPHGRPVIIAMSKYEIEKKFKRIV